MITYTRVDCAGASKGLFFGLLVLVSALICLILFFVLIDHGELHVSQLAVFLADISHASIMILSVLAILLGFCRQDSKRRIKKPIRDIMEGISQT